MNNMKHLKFSVIAIALVLGFASCKDDDTPSPELANFLKSGTWRATNFNDDGADKTGVVTGWTFTFSDNDNVTAVNGASTINGKWEVEGDDDGKEELDLEFGTSVLH